MFVRQLSVASSFTCRGTLRSATSLLGPLLAREVALRFATNRGPETKVGTSEKNLTLGGKANHSLP